MKFAIPYICRQIETTNQNEKEEESELYLKRHKVKEHCQNRQCSFL